MSEATKFVEDFDRLERGTYSHFVKSDSELRNFRNKWTVRAKEVEFQDFNGWNFDLTETYSFDDGSVAYLKNPKQEAYPARAFAGD